MDKTKILEQLNKLTENTSWNVLDQEKHPLWDHHIYLSNNGINLSIVYGNVSPIYLDKKEFEIYSWNKLFHDIERYDTLEELIKRLEQIVR